MIENALRIIVAAAKANQRMASALERIALAASRKGDQDILLLAHEGLYGASRPKERPQNLSEKVVGLLRDAPRSTRQVQMRIHRHATKADDVVALLEKLEREGQIISHSEKAKNGATVKYWTASTFHDNQA